MEYHSYNQGGRSCDQRHSARAIVCHASHCREGDSYRQRPFGARPKMSNKQEPMSGKTRSRKTDARVLRTHGSLGDALVALMHEKPFDSITVQEVLDRAAVGRSTFYSHFRDKDDLFLSDVEHFFELVSTMLTRCNDASNRVAPVCELFSH